MHSSIMKNRDYKEGGQCPPYIFPLTPGPASPALPGFAAVQPHSQWRPSSRAARERKL
jgi:hypothetical protein